MHTDAKKGDWSRGYIRVYPCLSVGFLVLAFSLAARIEPWFQTWDGFTSRQGNFMQVLMGDSRRMFANHFFVKADAYFHNGMQPTVFDEAQPDADHLAGHDEHGQHEEEQHSYLGEPTDWIDAFSRNFYPTKHTELPDAGTGEEREVLPWLKLSTDLDPHRVQSYLVAAYWLRERMNKVDEAEKYLREGLRANPGEPEILYELGRVAFESRHDHPRARFLWQRAQDQWQAQEGSKAEPDWFLLRNILSMRSRVEEEDGHIDLAVQFLQTATDAGPGSNMFDRRLQVLREKQATSSSASGQGEAKTVPAVP